jgi:hypothetical protein
VPYIKAEYREKLDNLVVYLTKRLQDIPEQDRAGALNYTFTRLSHCMCISYNLDRGDPPTWNYRSLNELTGVLENVKLEIARRITSPYENTKIKQYGDLLELSLTKE